jgi:hypothetical protein
MTRHLPDTEPVGLRLHPRTAVDNADGDVELQAIIDEASSCTCIPSARAPLLVSRDDLRAFPL